MAREEPDDPIPCRALERRHPDGRKRSSMAASTQAPAAPVTPEPVGERPPGSLRFDWLMLLVGIWPVVGAEYDAYTHINTPKLESFFTPAHATLYSGVAAVGLAA